MADPAPHTKFLTNLDEATLHEVNLRLEALERYVQEYRELIKRRRVLQIRLGKVTRADRVRQLLAAHPKGLTRSVIGEELELTNALSGVLGELKNQGHIDQPARGIYRLTDLGHEAVSKSVAAEKSTLA